VSASHDEDRLSAETTDAEEASVVDAEVVDAEQFGEALGGEPAESAEETDLEQDLSDLIAQARSERDEYLDLAQRTKADFDNYRKRMAAETAAAKVRGRLDVATGVITAIDNLERTMAVEEIDPAVALNGEMPADAPVTLQGVIVAYRDLHSALRSVEVEAFDPAGETFDPNLTRHLCGALRRQPPGTVLEVMQLGYRSGDSHPARPRGGESVRTKWQKTSTASSGCPRRHPRTR
jgi:molecular chaperone GrpE